MNRSNPIGIKGTIETHALPTQVREISKLADEYILRHQDEKGVISIWVHGIFVLVATKTEVEITDWREVTALAGRENELGFPDPNDEDARIWARPMGFGEILFARLDQ